MSSGISFCVTEAVFDIHFSVRCVFQMYAFVRRGSAPLIGNQVGSLERDEKSHLCTYSMRGITPRIHGFMMILVDVVCFSRRYTVKHCKGCFFSSTHQKLMGKHSLDSFGGLESVSAVAML